MNLSEADFGMVGSCKWISEKFLLFFLQKGLSSRYSHIFFCLLESMKGLGYHKCLVHKVPENGGRAVAHVQSVKIPITN